MSEQKKLSHKISQVYEHTLGRLIAAEHLFPLLLMIALNCSVYYITDTILGNAPRATLALALDERIPLVDAFIIPYFLSYLCWVGIPIYLARKDASRFYDMAGAFFIGIIVAFLFFVFMPLTIERPEVMGEGLFSDAVRFLYRIDKPHNLCPSLHCLHTWMCYLTVRGRREHPPALRVGLFVFSLFVFASTVFLRQHYLLDIVFGVAIAEIAMLVSAKTGFSRCLSRFFSRLARKSPPKS